MSVSNRETWLQSAVDVLRDAVFKPHGITVPELRLSVGLPHARNQREILVQHHAAAHTSDKVAQIFVNPSMSDGAAVLAQLHNCLFKVYGGHFADRPPFGAEEIRMISEVLGGYPQGALQLPANRKQDTRMLKMVCKSCGYVCRATAKWLKSKGEPFCSCKLNSSLEPGLSLQHVNSLTRMEVVDSNYIPF